jgi:Na+-transporting methylmalonyl-CoA/oxaloacetate decarboxylase gamma subunit
MEKVVIVLLWAGVAFVVLAFALFTVLAPYFIYRISEDVSQIRRMLETRPAPKPEPKPKPAPETKPAPKPKPPPEPTPIPDHPKLSITCGHCGVDLDLPPSYPIGTTCPECNHLVDA